VEIMETYERFERELKARGISSFSETEGGGIWAPTRLEDIIPFLEYVTEKGIVHPSEPVSVAGSGDGRVSAVLDVYGFNPIVNIERDRRLVEASKEVIDDLVQRGIVSGNIVTVQGDYTQSDAYEKAGIKFEEIPFFYSGIDYPSTENLGGKIDEESPVRTILVVHGLIYEGNQPDIPLRLIATKQTRDLFKDFLVYEK
jgi:hypothetical protein